MSYFPRKDKVGRWYILLSVLFLSLYNPFRVPRLHVAFSSIQEKKVFLNAKVTLRAKNSKKLQTYRQALFSFNSFMKCICNQATKVGLPHTICLWVFFFFPADPGEIT